MNYIHVLPIHANRMLANLISFLIFLHKNTLMQIIFPSIPFYFSINYHLLSQGSIYLYSGSLLQEFENSKMDFQHVFICWKVSGRIFEREKKHCMNGLIQPPWGYNQQLIIILLIKTEKVIKLMGYF